MDANELIDNMAKDALNYADTNIILNQEELVDPDVFNKCLLKIYNFTTICFEIVLDKFRNENDETIHLYDIMNAKRRFDTVMKEVENRLIFAKINEERRLENESDSRCETQSPE